MKIDVVVGAQFGSEAKGHVTQRLLDDYLERKKDPRASVAVVRVAGPNAGHTGHAEDGTAVAFRQLPMSALRPGVPAVIAAGSEINPEVLLEEIDKAIRFADFDPAWLRVDGEATILEPEHIVAEAGMHEATGSTGKGIGAARAARVMRKAKRLVDDYELCKKLDALGAQILNTTGWLQSSPDVGRIIIEGTQGWGLGLHAGYYPYCTSSDCRAVDFLAMAGLNPWFGNYQDLNVWAVARVYPIRVAGNSGPLLNETTWNALGLPEERTTVTNKVRRVGQWDQNLINQAVQANGGSPTVKLAITMLDQKFFDVKGATHAFDVLGSFAMDWVREVEAASHCKVKLVTTGPNTGAFI